MKSALPNPTLASAEIPKSVGCWVRKRGKEGLFEERSLFGSRVLLSSFFLPRSQESTSPRGISLSPSHALARAPLYHSQLSFSSDGRNGRPPPPKKNRREERSGMWERGACVCVFSVCPGTRERKEEEGSEGTLGILRNNRKEGNSH